jgi:hypothetical protein
MCVAPSFGTVIIIVPPLAVTTRESPVVGAEWPHEPVDVQPDVAAMLCVPLPVMVKLHGCADVPVYAHVAFVQFDAPDISVLVVVSALAPTVEEV